MDSGSDRRENDVLIYDRSKISLTGIDDVVEFSDNSITLSCSYGSLTLEGASLKIESFDSESGKLSVSGTLDGLVYFDDSPRDKKSRRRLFR